MDSRHPLKRLIHASSEDELLRTAGKNLDRGLVMQTLVQTLQAEQRLHDKMKSQTLILFTGMIFFPVTEARLGEISGTSSVEATFTC
ncbi:hypothetical protein BDZ89DRAFT_1073861 [Hymenopellis radicata]|nr:hypothetical protein BDZ89DRAFT_1073861 [Hymenopellis radicata]